MFAQNAVRKAVALIILSLFLNLALIPPRPARANDTDIYSAGASLKPNVMIVMDTSGSMGETIPYDDAADYGDSPYPRNNLYRYTCTRTNPKTGTCQAADWLLYTGAFTDNIVNRTGAAGHDGIDDNNYDIKSGKRLNYELGANPNKLTIAKNVLNSLVDLMAGTVNFGLMKFHTDDGADIISTIGAQITALHGQINAMNAQNTADYTPLAESLTDAGKYFENTYTGQPSPLNSTNWCERNFVIIVTDGAPSRDTDISIVGHFLDRGQTGITDANRGQKWDQTSPSDYLFVNATSHSNNDVWVTDDTYTAGERPQTFLDDVAKYLYTHDLRSDLPGTQNVITYTVGFTYASALLEKTAQEGGGKYYQASTANELSRALLQALDDIAQKLQTYTAPVVPVTRTSSGDKMYLAFFKPLAFTKFWIGDLQKYGISDTNRIVDRNGNPATDASGNMLDTAQPYWSAEKVLQARTTARNIYTYLPDGSGNYNSDLTNAQNAFSTTNSSLTYAVLGSPSLVTGDTDETKKNRLINYIRGFDAYDEDGDTNTTEKKDQILGDVLHSVPLVLDYAAPTASDPNRYIFFGANDGMLHCINDTDGSEQWAFVPPDALPRLKELKEGTAHPYYVDSSPKVYQERDASGTITKAILVFGERKGGDNYYALDVTIPASPRYLWRINSSTTGFSELGQTWSDPVIGKVKKNDGAGNPAERKAAIFGAGFDPAQADISTVNTAAKGRGIFIVDVLTGGLIQSFTNASDSGLAYAVPSEVAAVDRNFDSFIDKIYVGDLGGNLWRFAAPAGSDNLIDNWVIRRQFASNPDSSSGRKIYYAPDITFKTGYDYVFFGTGDRDNPRSTTAVDRLYAVKDTNPASGFTTLTEITLTDQTSAINEVTNSGFYIRLAGSGEKVLAPAVLFNKYVIYDTFTPNNLACDVGGRAKTYIVNLSGGYTWYNLGSGIPTGAVLVMRPTGTTAFVGSAAGVINLSDLTPTTGNYGGTMTEPISFTEDVFNFRMGSIFQISWKEVF